MSGIKLDFGFRLRDIVIVFSGLLILSAILIPTGVHIGFLVLGDFWKIELQNSSVPEVLWAHLATWKFVWLAPCFSSVLFIAVTNKSWKYFPCSFLTPGW
jgi:hypothetical protein